MATDLITASTRMSFIGTVRVKPQRGGVLQSRRALWLSGTALRTSRRFSVARIGNGGGGGNKRGLMVRCNESDEVDMPPLAPEYTSYVDPHTGEPAPTYGARTPLPHHAYWGDDMQRILRSSRASTPRGESKRSSRLSRDYVSKRKNSSVARRDAEKMKVPNEFEEEEEEEEEEEDFVPLTKEQIAAEKKVVPVPGKQDLWYTKNDPENDPIKEALYQMEEELESESDAENEAENEAKNEDEDADEDENDVGGVDGDVAGLVKASKEDGSLVESAEPGALSNSELWWNWQKPPKEKEPWSAWQKRCGDGDTVMAAAMAKSGQIKLFGEKPSIAEASLARARKRVFYEKRMREEEARRKEVGALAYYKEWVKAWKEDTSLPAVKAKAKRTGEGVVDQLMDMMQQQSRREYRQMQGTDIRIRRDPLTMRMTEEEVKQVWGGDPVYPTINYEQDPDCVADFRNANMHEPTPNILEQLRDDNRLITQEELQELLAKEEREAKEVEGGSYDDGFSGAIDIGDKEDDDDEDDDDDELEVEDDTRDDAAWKANVNKQQQLPSGKTKASREPKKLSPVVDLLDGIDASDLLEYVGSEGDGEPDYLEELGIK